MDNFVINYIKICAIIGIFVVIIFIITRMISYYSLYYQDRNKSIIVNYYKAMELIQNCIKDIEPEDIRSEHGLFCGSIKVTSSPYSYSSPYRLRIKGCIITIEKYKVYMYPLSCIHFIFVLHKINVLIKNNKKRKIKQDHDEVYYKLFGGKS